MPAPPTSKQQKSLKTPANTKAKSSGYQTGTNYSAKTAPKSGSGGSKGLLGSATSTAYGGRPTGTGGTSGGLLAQAQSKGKSGYAPGTGGQPARPGTGGSQPTIVSGGRGVQAYDIQPRSYSNPATYSPTNPFMGGRSTAFKGVNLSGADLLDGGYGAYQQPPGYSNPAAYRSDTPFGTLNGAGGRSEYQPGMNYSGGDYAQAGYGDYQQPPGAMPRQAPQFAAGGSPYPGGITAPPMPGDFPTADPPRPISRVAGGKGVQPYSPIGNSYQNGPVYTPPTMAKIQDRVPDTSIAMDPSLAGRAMAASRNLFAGGVPGGYGMQAYDNPAFVSPTNGAPSQQASTQEPINELYGSVQDGTGPGYTGGEGMVPESTNPVTNTARTIAAKISGPLAKADSALGRMFPGMEATQFGSNVDPFRIGGGGDILSNGGNGLDVNGNQPTPPAPINPNTPPGTGGGNTPPIPPALLQLLYPQYYTKGAWANLPTGPYPVRTI